MAVVRLRAGDVRRHDGCPSRILRSHWQLESSYFAATDTCDVHRFVLRRHAVERIDALELRLHKLMEAARDREVGAAYFALHQLRQDDPATLKAYEAFLTKYHSHPRAAEARDELEGLKRKIHKSP